MYWDAYSAPICIYIYMPMHIDTVYIYMYIYITMYVQTFYVLYEPDLVNMT